MHLTLYRFSDGKEDTLGLLAIDCDFECFTLEDEFRSVKVKGETRIPAGVYEIQLRKVDSPLTLKYRNKFSWFKYHLQIMDVPNFENVYIHIGNYDTNTDGCVLVGDSSSNVANDQHRRNIGVSTSTFERVYKKITKALETDTVFVTIKDPGQWVE